jgi:hypothetical protein
MKAIPALLVALAFACPASAQVPALKGMQLHRKTPTTVPAFGPIILQTGKPITQNDKLQLYSLTAKAFAAKTPGAKFSIGNQVTNSLLNPSATITPLQLFKPGFVDVYLYSPITVNMAEPFIGFVPTSMNGGEVMFYINVNSNTAYVLTFKLKSPDNGPQFQLNADASASTPGVSVSTGLQTVNGSKGENEFAFAFVPSSTGLIQVSLLSPNASWEFQSCEITATPLN